jgi:hypothetical protein
VSSSRAGDTRACRARNDPFGLGRQADFVAARGPDDERNSSENGITEDAMMKVQIGTLCAKFYVEQLRELLRTAAHRGM